MDPWRLGTTYDRPIPRRIAESAGVPRGMFGQTKMASVTSFPVPSFPCNSDLSEEYEGFLIEHQLLSRWQVKLVPLVHHINGWLAFKKRKYKSLYYFERIGSRLIGYDWRIPKLWRRLNGSLYCYCVNKRAQEYATWLRRAEANPLTNEHIHQS